MLALFKSHKGVLGMELMWGGHIDGIDVRAHTEILDAVVNLAAKLSCKFIPSLLSQVGACCELNIGMVEYFREGRRGGLAQTSNAES